VTLPKMLGCRRLLSPTGILWRLSISAKRHEKAMSGNGAYPKNGWTWQFSENDTWLNEWISRVPYFWIYPNIHDWPLCVPVNCMMFSPFSWHFLCEMATRRIRGTALTPYLASQVARMSIAHPEVLRVTLVHKALQRCGGAFRRNREMHHQSHRLVVSKTFICILYV
jgi:hypothetical protein